jgi:hypothetical protein
VVCLDLLGAPCCPRKNRDYSFSVVSASRDEERWYNVGSETGRVNGEKEQGVSIGKAAMVRESGARAKGKRR